MNFSLNVFILAGVFLAFLVAGFIWDYKYGFSRGITKGYRRGWFEGAFAVGAEFINDTFHGK